VSRTCVASLLSLSVEAHGQDLQNGRRLSWAETDHVFLLKEGFKPLDIHSRLYAVCGKKAPACSIVLNWVRSFKCSTETAQGGKATSLQNGFVQPSKISAMNNLRREYTELPVVQHSA
jgi:hypothetical protein